LARPFGVVTKTGKFVGNDILNQYSVKEASRKLLSDVFDKHYGTQGLVQPLYKPNILARALEINTYHYRCCRVKARETAGLGWDLKPVPGIETPNQRQYDEVSEFFDDLPEPISSVFNKMMFDFESIGYGTVELVRENYSYDGKPVLLTHIPSHTVRIHKDGNRYCQIRGTQKRWFKALEYEKDVDYLTGQEHELGSLGEERRATELIWIVNYTPRSDYYGISDIIPALGAVHGDISRRNYNISFFDNFGVPAYAVFVTGNFEDEEELDSNGNPTGRTLLEAEIEEHFKELAKSPHSTLILSVPTKDRQGEVKIEFKPLAVETKEASFRLFRKDNRDEILSAHGVPPYRAGIAETGSLGGTTAKESTEIYKRSIIEPRQETLETLINRYIVWGAFEANDWKFKFAEIDTTDEKHDIEVLGKLFGVAAVTPNQIIRHFKDRFGLEEVDHPAMDAHYLGGTPIDRDDVVLDDMQAAMLSLQDKLLKIAEKHQGNGYEADDITKAVKEMIGNVGT